MSWLYSQALVEEYLGANCLDGEQSAPLSGSNTPQAYCAPDKMTGFSRLSRFGMTFKPLPENLGEELLTLYLEGFHAKTSQALEKAQELTVSEVECGEKWRASFTKYDPDLSLWKTHQCSLLGDLELFLETWPQWGLMRDGECWEQRTLEQTTKGTGYGLSQNKWATPTTMDKLPPKSEKSLMREATINRPGRSKPANLRDQVSNMQKWPTPCATDYKGSGQTGQLRDRLDYAAERGATKSKTYGAGNGGQLNPMWVEWLMGWPLGWTDLKPLGTGKSHSVPPQPGQP